MKVIKEKLSFNNKDRNKLKEAALKNWTYTEDEIFDVAYQLMNMGYLEGWEAADIQSALLYADHEQIGDAPYLFTMEDDEEEYESLTESSKQYEISFWLNGNSIEHITLDTKNRRLIQKELDNMYGKGATEIFDIEALDESLHESKVVCSLNDVRDWVAEHDQALDDIENHYNKSINKLSKDEIYDWLADHDQMYRDFIQHFKIDESLHENMNNVTRALDSDIDAVTEIPIVMADAVIDDKKANEYIRKNIKKNNRVFLGATKQPVPKDIVEPKAPKLEESLFEAYDTDIVAAILSGVIPKPTSTRVFKYLSSNGENGEVMYRGTRYAYRKRPDDTYRVMRSSDAGSNWSETLYKESLIETFDDPDNSYRDHMYQNQLWDYIHANPDEAQTFAELLINNLSENDSKKYLDMLEVKYIDNEKEYLDSLATNESLLENVDTIKKSMSELRNYLINWQHDHLSREYVKDVEAAGWDADTDTYFIALVNSLMQDKNESLKESVIDDIYRDVTDYIQEVIMNSLDNIAIEVASKVPEYNPDWCAEESDYERVNKTSRNLAMVVAKDLFENRPEVEESLKESLSEDDLDNFKHEMYQAMADAVFKYNWKGISKSDIDRAIDNFQIRFFDDENSSYVENESLKEEYIDYRDRLFEIIDELIDNADDIAKDLVYWLSTDECKKFIQVNGLLDFIEEDEDEEKSSIDNYIDDNYDGDSRDLLFDFIEQGMVDSSELAKEIAYWISNDDCKRFMETHGLDEYFESEEENESLKEARRSKNDRLTDYERKYNINDPHDQAYYDGDDIPKDDPERAAKKEARRKEYMELHHIEDLANSEWDVDDRTKNLSDEEADLYDRLLDEITPTASGFDKVTRVPAYSPQHRIPADKVWTDYDSNIVVLIKDEEQENMIYDICDAYNIKVTPSENADGTKNLLLHTKEIANTLPTIAEWDAKNK